MITFSRVFVKRHGFHKIQSIVPGGKRRQDSVKNGFQAVDRAAVSVAIHDGARPAVTPELIDKGLRLCRKYRAVIFGLPVTDTVKSVRGHRVLSTLSRDELFLIQTPQFFQVDLLARSYDRVDFHKNYTDESGLVEAAGYPVYHFPGDRNNIKITDRDDLRMLNGRL
jgi:2-C-methyl-D-erythritol 4-phosphate cytidylyltransferase